MTENRTYETFPRERVGAGDFTVQQVQMMSGPNRWAVVRYTGTMHVTMYTCRIRSEAVRMANREWKAVLRRQR